ncbi:hypothetical protein ACTL6U_07915 [Rhodovibrionaceae bacterium A322]
MDAYRKKPDSLGQDCELHVCLIMGASGPFVKAENDFLQLDIPREGIRSVLLPEGTLDWPLSSYDAIIVSALGYMDGGHMFDSLIQRRGVLPEFGPRADFATGEVISDACMKRIVKSVWTRGHRGFKLIKAMRNTYSGPIFVQPYPRLSSCMQNQETWRLRTYYDDYLGAHAFFCRIQQDLLRELSQELDFHLLAYPEEALDPDNRDFSKVEFMNKDMLHTLPDYSAFHLDEIAQKLAPLS